MKSRPVADRLVLLEVATCLLVLGVSFTQAETRQDQENRSPQHPPVTAKLLVGAVEDADISTTQNADDKSKIIQNSSADKRNKPHLRESSKYRDPVRFR